MLFLKICCSSPDSAAISLIHCPCGQFSSLGVLPSGRHSAQSSPVLQGILNPLLISPPVRPMRCRDVVSWWCEAWLLRVLTQLGLALLFRILNVVCKLAWQLRTITASDFRLCVSDSRCVHSGLILLSFIKAKKKDFYRCWQWNKPAQRNENRSVLQGCGFYFCLDH